MRVTKAPYGFVIEFEYDTSNGYRIPWTRHPNRKIYRTQEAANDAIQQMKKVGFYEKHQFRILPVFL